MIWGGEFVGWDIGEFLGIRRSNRVEAGNRRETGG
jgi:hypothetical protein